MSTFEKTKISALKNKYLTKQKANDIVSFTKPEINNNQSDNGSDLKINKDKTIFKLETYKFRPTPQEMIIKPIKGLFIPILNWLTDVEIRINSVNFRDLLSPESEHYYPPLRFFYDGYMGNTETKTEKDFQEKHILLLKIIIISHLQKKLALIKIYEELLSQETTADTEQVIHKIITARIQQWFIDFYDDYPIKDSQKFRKNNGFVDIFKNTPLDHIAHVLGGFCYTIDNDALVITDRFDNPIKRKKDKNNEVTKVLTLKDLIAASKTILLAKNFRHLICFHAPLVIEPFDIKIMIGDNDFKNKIYPLYKKLLERLSYHQEKIQDTECDLPKGAMTDYLIWRFLESKSVADKFKVNLEIQFYVLCEANSVSLEDIVLLKESRIAQHLIDSIEYTDLAMVISNQKAETEFVEKIYSTIFNKNQMRDREGVLKMISERLHLNLSSKLILNNQLNVSNTIKLR
jgi:hypothetical protein